MANPLRTSAGQIFEYPLHFAQTAAFMCVQTGKIVFPESHNARGKSKPASALFPNKWDNRE